MGNLDAKVKRLGPLEEQSPTPKIIHVILKQAGAERMSYVGYFVLETVKEIYVAQRKITEGRKHYYGFMKEIPKSRIESLKTIWAEGQP